MVSAAVLDTSGVSAIAVKLLQPLRNGLVDGALLTAVRPLPVHQEGVKRGAGGGRIAGISDGSSTCATPPAGPPPRLTPTRPLT
jgi:hypothetical protein